MHRLVRIAKTLPLPHGSARTRVASRDLGNACDEYVLTLQDSCQGLAAPLEASAIASEWEDNFSSFELENELLQARQDLSNPVNGSERWHDHGTASSAPRAPAIVVTPHAKETLKGQWHQQQRQLPGSAPTPLPSQSVKSLAPHQSSRHFTDLPLQGVIPTIALSEDLQRSRWRSVVHERYRTSVPGYTAAVTCVFRRLYREWGKLEGHRNCSEEAVGASSSSQPLSFARYVNFGLRHLHADALLVLIEMVTQGEGGSVVNDGCSFSTFAETLIVQLLLLLCQRPMELSGKHMAHLSRLLLQCHGLFYSKGSADAVHDRTRRGEVAAATAADVRRRYAWKAFTFLCYATRRSLRREQNMACLEAFLWGAYGSVVGEFGRGGDRRADHSASGGESRAATSPSGEELESYDVLGPYHDVASCLPPQEVINSVRQAVLNHLLSRCLESGRSASMKRAAAPTMAEEGEDTRREADLLLSWALLLARFEMHPVVREAVVRRLSRPADGGDTSTCQSHPSTGGQQQWRRLALGVEEQHRGSEDSPWRHRQGSADCAEVYQRVERLVKATGSWAVSSADRHLLRAAHARKPFVVSLDAKGERALKPLSRRVGVEASASTSARQRVEQAASLTVRAYIRLRWSPPATGAAPRQVWEEELDEVLETALAISPRGQCLAEALYVHLLRCLRLLDAPVSDREAALCSAPSPTDALTTVARAPLQRQRAVFAALAKLSYLTRLEVVAGKLLLLLREPSGTVCDGRTTCTKRPNRPSASLARGGGSVTDQRPEWWRYSFPIPETPAGAVRMVQALCRIREMATFPLPPAAVRHLRHWVLALPAPLHSPKLLDVLAAWIEVEAGKEDAEQGCSGLERTEDTAEGWSELLRTARQQHTAQNYIQSFLSVSGQEGFRRVFELPSPSGAELQHTYTTMTGPASVQLRRLQLMARVNDSVEREWRWATCGTAPTDSSDRSIDRSEDAVRLVMASEDEICEADLQQLNALCRHCFTGLLDINATHWRDLDMCRTLDAFSWTVPFSPLRVDEHISVRESKMDTGSAGSDEGTLGHEISERKLLDTPISPVVLHYLGSCIRGVDAQAPYDSPSSSLHRAGPTSNQRTLLGSANERADALWDLAVYVAYLWRTSREVGGSAAQDDSSRQSHHLRSCAAAAFLRCLGDWWGSVAAAAPNHLSTARALDNGPSNALGADLVTLCLFSLHFYEEVYARASELEESKNHETRQPSLPFPPLPSSLTDHVLGILARSNGAHQSWALLEATLVRLHHLAGQKGWGTSPRASPVLQSDAAGSVAATSLRTTIPSFLPLATYEMILAAYVAQGVRVPPRVRACCEEAMRCGP